MEGIERIKILGSEIKHKSTRKVVNYLLSRTDMNDKYLNEEKSLKQMIQFIRREIRKQAEVEKEQEYFVEDEEVYSLAIHYFDETNENLGLVIKKENKVEHITEDSEDEETTDDDDKEVTIESKKSLNQIKPKNVPEGQLSIFDM